MASLFFSYSHKDEDLRNELEVHLSALKRRGIINTWHDRRIVAGQDFGHEIDKQLEQADVILLLISPDFIASDYCYNIEVRRALDRHESGEARVIPVILRPCDWKDLPFGSLLAAPIDGKPVTKYPNRDEAFLEIVEAIKKALNFKPESFTSGRNEATPKPESVSEVIRSSNLRIKKQFTDQDRDNFLHDTFEYISNYFEGSLRELERRNTEIGTSFHRDNSSSFNAAIYRNGSSVSRCQVRLENQGLFSEHGGSIAYSTGGSEGSFNDMLYVETGDQSLFLNPMGTFHLGDFKPQLSQEGAAEYYWSEFIRPLQY